MIQFEPRPMMNPNEVEAMRKLLLARAPKRVLEWGAGGSTCYWPAEFPDISWTTIEHDQAWMDAVAAKMPRHVKLFWLEFPEYYQLRPEYGTFDLIIVDGRQRVRCMDAARKLLNPGGAVVVHDFTRARYAGGLELYNKAEVLAPPTKTKDPRGLLLLTDPKPDYGPVVPATMDRGVMYMCWGEPATRQAEASIRSLRLVEPEMPVMIIGDDKAVEFFTGRPLTTARKCDVDPFKSASLFGFHAGRVKPLLASLSPFTRTLYVDADTEFKASPAVGFKLLDQWDMVLAEAETRSLALTFPDNRTEAGETAEWLGSPQVIYHNSGMIFWRRNEVTLKLFEAWSQEWRRYRGWDEQIALLRALLVSPDVLWLNVPYTWNCRGPIDSFLVYHRFASRAARKFNGLEVRVVPNPRGQPMAPARPLIKFEVEPGRFVKIHPGDEAAVIAHFKQMKSRKPSWPSSGRAGRGR